ncbi:DUF4352 domain-containing protein [Nakamurella silvestris]|nr:DUF4352 domain-containing protein [Nakamurella silvestris]
MTQVPEDRTNRTVRLIAVIAAVCAVALAIWAPIYLINRSTPAGEMIHVVDDPDVLSSTVDRPVALASPTVGAAWPVEFPDGKAQVTVHKAGWVKTGKGKGADPTSGNYLVLDVSLESMSGAVTFDSRYFTALDALGASFVPDRNKAGYTPVLGSGDLAAGTTVRGRVVFDLPKGETTVELAEPGAGVLATWQIPG